MKLFSNYSKKQKNGGEPDKMGNPVPAAGENRTPEEELEIEARIAQFQKKRMITRLVLLGVMVVFAITAFIVTINSTIKPPPVNNNDGPVLNSSPTMEPTPTSNPGTTAEPSPSASPSPSPSAAPSNRKPDFYTFIVVGNDAVSGSTDTMILGSFDKKNNKLNLCSIPRDTCVNVSWDVKKVNTLLSFRDIDGLKDGLRDITGFTVDSYFIVDLEAFETLIDTLGGVYFDVPVNMYYHDPLQDLNIDIASGYQRLDGKSALGVVRYRGYAAADIQRIQTQQDFLKAVAAQTLKLGNLFKVNEFVDIFKEYVVTDLSVGTLIWYATSFLDLNEGDINFMTLPANYIDSVNALSYCTIYVDEWLDIVNQYFNPYNVDIGREHVNILTRDSSGNLYATNGTIAGGIGSFYDNTDYDSYDEPEETEVISIEDDDSSYGDYEDGEDETESEPDTDGYDTDDNYTEDGEVQDSEESESEPEAG